MVLAQDGSVWATGNNEYGQLGDGTFDNKKSFVMVMPSGRYHGVVQRLMCRYPYTSALTHTHSLLYIYVRHSNDRHPCHPHVCLRCYMQVPQRYQQAKNTVWC